MVPEIPFTNIYTSGYIRHCTVQYAAQSSAVSELVAFASTRSSRAEQLVEQHIDSVVTNCTYVSAINASTSARVFVV